MNEFNRKPVHAVPNWQAPASTGKKQPAIEESQVEGSVCSSSNLLLFIIIIIIIIIILIFGFRFRGLCLPLRRGPCPPLLCPVASFFNCLTHHHRSKTDAKTPFLAFVIPKTKDHLRFRPEEPPEEPSTDPTVHKHKSNQGAVVRFVRHSRHRTCSSVRLPLFLRCVQRREAPTLLVNSHSYDSFSCLSHVQNSNVRTQQLLKHNEQPHHMMNNQAYLLLAVALSLSRCGAQQLRIGAPALGELTLNDRGDVTNQILGPDFAN